MTTTTDRTDTTAADQASARWRTVDIVVASALGVAFGVVFWAWNTLWNGLEGAFAGFPPGRAFLYGMWMVPAVLGPLVIRKRGAAVYVELVASVVSALLGSPWGLYVVAYGLIQGAAGELVFALTLYRSWRLPTAVLAGAAAGARGRPDGPGLLLPGLVRGVAADLRRARRRQRGRRRRARLVAAGPRPRPHRGAVAVPVRGRPGPGLTALTPRVDADTPLMRRVW